MFWVSDRREAVPVINRGWDERWMSMLTGKERTWGSRALASQVNPTSWYYQRARKQNCISSSHFLKRSGGCHFYLCTAWCILCTLGFISSRKYQRKYFQRIQTEKCLLSDPDHTEVSTKSELTVSLKNRSALGMYKCVLRKKTLRRESKDFWSKVAGLLRATGASVQPQFHFFGSCV